MVAQMVMGENGNQMSNTLLDSIHTPELNTKTFQLFLRFHTWMPEFYDASINGIEIFKMSDRNNNLAAPSPVLSEMQAQHMAKASHKKFQKDHKRLTIVGTAGGDGFFFIAAACIAAYRRKKIIPVFDSHTSTWLPVHGNPHTGSKPTISGKSTQSSHLSSLAQGLCRHFTLPEILRATKNFDGSNVIGVGGFGKVYKGVIDQTTKKWPSKDQIHNQNRELMSS